MRFDQMDEAMVLQKAAEIGKELASDKGAISAITNAPQIILTVDGPDGSGKATVTKILKAIFNECPISSWLISPPFYDTKSGQIVKDYLMNGPQCITSRKVVSMLYSMDRNLFYRENMKDMMRNKILIFDRSWLSNLIYQTTVYLPKDTDFFVENCKEISIKHEDHQFAKFASLAKLYDAITNNDRDALGGIPRASAMDLLNQIRTENAIGMADLIYRVEIDPWRVENDSSIFQKGFIFNAILNPGYDSDILMRNMSQRYGGDSNQNDRNENAKFQYSVIDNIVFLYDNQADLYKNHGYLRPFFSFHMIETTFNAPIFNTPYFRSEDEIMQRSPFDIAKEIITKLLDTLP